MEDGMNSLYERIGGKAAVEAAVDLFYKKVLADTRINMYFQNISMPFPCHSGTTPNTMPLNFLLGLNFLIHKNLSL